MKIGFIGAGKVGRALGVYFKNHGLEVAGYISRSRNSAEEAAKITGTKAYPSMEALQEEADVIFITTPDGAIAEVAGEAAAKLRAPCGTTWIHASGAFGSDRLSALSAMGCPVGSMHPLQSFGEPLASAEKLEKTFFSIEGGEKGLEVIKSILEKTGGRYNLISTEHKPLYHAGACVISNYLVTLLDSGMRYMEAAGMDRRSLYQAIEPLIEGTLENISRADTVSALTGPIARGDMDTLKAHLDEIEKDLPGELALYQMLAVKTAEMIRDKRLTGEKSEAIEKLMERGRV